jgi:hypothetical protein
MEWRRSGHPPFSFMKSSTRICTRSERVEQVCREDVVATIEVSVSDGDK